MTFSEIAVGDRVVWLHNHRGGYGYTTPIDGRVTRIGWRVEIEVLHKERGLVRRWVKPEYLRPATTEAQP